MQRLLYPKIEKDLETVESIEVYACYFDVSKSFEINKMSVTKGIIKKTKMKRVGGGYTSEIHFFKYKQDGSISKNSTHIYFLYCFYSKEEANQKYIALKETRIQKLNTMKCKIDECIEEISKM